VRLKSILVSNYKDGIFCREEGEEKNIKKHEKEIGCFLHMNGDMFYCNNAVELMTALWHEHKPEEQRLFSDSSKLVLKVVVLHNGKRLPSIPVAHAMP
jgi:formyltetrahydrofolate synthetase